MTAFFGFIKESYQELKKVSWPTKKQTLRLTGFVIGVSVLVGLYVSGLDYIFKEFLRWITNQI